MSAGEKAGAYDAAVTKIALELFGPECRKAYELLELVDDAGGWMEAEDSSLDRFCDDMPAGDDTINLCFDAGYLDQVGSEDAFAVVLRPKGKELVDSAQELAARKTGGAA